MLNINNENCFDPKKIDNPFKDFFTHVASNLVNKLPPCPNIFISNSDNFKQFYHEKIQIQITQALEILLKEMFLNNWICQMLKIG